MVSLLSVLGILSLLAGEPERDRAAILAQCGCYEVTYSYTETEALKPGYPLRPPKTLTALEWVEADAVSERSLSLQHVLIGKQGVQKHWRQVWEYAPREIFEYQGHGRWKKRRIPPSQSAGRWVQRVYEVDDGPRYEGLGSWNHGPKPFWESRAWSPLPRREYTQRRDYDVLARRNRHQLSADGWEHVQENRKLKLEDGKVVPLVLEGGVNRYRRVEDARCAPARSTWAAEKATWHRIQRVWQEVYETSETLTFRVDPTEKPRWQRIFELAAQNPPDLEREVRAAIREDQRP